MRLSVVLMGLFASIQTVQCGKLANPYEMLFLYYAYQIDEAAKASAVASGVDWDEIISPACQGKDCTFGTFVKSTLTKKGAKALTPTALGDSRSPELYETAQDMVKNWKYDFHTLVLDKVISGAKNNMREMIAVATLQVQGARGVKPSSPLVEKAWTALRYAQAERLTDMIQNVYAKNLKGFKAVAFKAQYPDIKLESTKRVLGQDTTAAVTRDIMFTDLDYVKMAGNYKGTDAAKLEEYQTTLKDYLAWAEGPMDTVSGLKSHNAHARLYGEFSTFLSTGCGLQLE
ncbi:uncharacterized protein N7511_004869 [Penicillium nucicola]|uniref:uncharacterized protein n=1 Tax=Penicillium nucicola TaxID=1850975 RepID=UPI002544E551|nr:uncharacterized protein N7511_004869 [Penicillium nucicola]KAJ5767253.1 hypothetical protein N7511_004869 [Penicillium nucicola]